MASRQLLGRKNRFLKLTLAALLTSLSTPYPSMAIAAGNFKQTCVGAYVAATLFRFVYYVYYLSKNIINRGIWLGVKRETVNICGGVLIYEIGRFVVSEFAISSYGEWVLVSSIVSAIALTIYLTANLVCY